MHPSKRPHIPVGKHHHTESCRGHCLTWVLSFVSYNDFRTVKGIRNKFYYELAVFRLAFVLLYVVGRCVFFPKTLLSKNQPVISWFFVGSYLCHQHVDYQPDSRHPSARDGRQEASTVPGQSSLTEHASSGQRSLRQSSDVHPDQPVSSYQDPQGPFTLSLTQTGFSSCYD